MKKHDFIVYGKKGFLNINTLSPNMHYFYKVRNVYEINMGNYGCEIAFYKLLHKEVLYYRKDAISHWIPPIDTINFVKWSVDGNFALFYEIFNRKSFEYVLLDLVGEKSYRVDLYKYPDSFLEKLENEKFNGTEVVMNLVNQGILSMPLLKEKISFFPFNRWKPSINRSKNL